MAWHSTLATVLAPNPNELLPPRWLTPFPTTPTPSYPPALMPHPRAASRQTTPQRQPSAPTPAPRRAPLSAVLTARALGRAPVTPAEGPGMKWYAAAPVVGAVGLGAVLSGYDGAMQPVRAERQVLRACTNHLRSIGVSMGEADDACDCMVAKADASGEPLTPDGTKRAYDQCTLVHVTPEAIGSDGGTSPFGPGRAPVDSGGWGKADPDTGG